MNPTITRWHSLTDPEGRAEQIAWSDLFAEFSKPRPRYRHDEHPGWSPAEFDPCRRARENVTRVHAACLDYDDGCTIEAALALWSDCYGLICTTRKHLPDAPRFRVILPWSRPVSRFEHEALWLRLNAHAGGALDPAPKDPSRFWYTPGAYEPQFFEAHALAGKVLIPDEWLAKTAPIERVIPPVEPARFHDPSAIERRACAYIARMPEAISGSGGHQAAWHVALVLVKGFGLSGPTAERLFASEYNPRCSPPWSKSEIEHKIADATAARVPSGFLLEGDREWKPDRYRLPPAPRPVDAPANETAPEPPAESESELQRQPGDDTAEIEQESAERPALERYGFLSMADLMSGVVTELRKPKPRRGVPTGHHKLDDAIGGFRPGNVTVFGAKRGVGKSTYSNLVTNLALDAGYRVLLFAGEDSELMYGTRFLAQRANLNAMRLRDLQVDRTDWSAIISAVADAPKQLFFVRVDDRPVEWIAQVIRDVAAEQQIDLVIVDYIQCIKTAERKPDRRLEVSHVAKTLSAAIKAARAAGLLLSQLKRTERIVPEVEDLKESGDVEDMAEHILLAWKEENGSGPGATVTRKIKLGKNKDGIDATALGEIEMPFDPKTAAFKQQREEPDEWQDSFTDR